MIHYNQKQKVNQYSGCPIWFKTELGATNIKHYWEGKKSLARNQINKKIFQQQWIETPTDFKLFLDVVLQLWNLADPFPPCKLRKTCSALALKVIGNKSDLRILYEQLHKINGRGTLSQMMNYKHSLQLFKLYNNKDQSDDWFDINFNQSFNNRCDKVKFFYVSKTKIGRNLL